ncbi:MAG TPA: TGS domain-containing protein, partial [Clostridia bacterium]|nr:TGS domain-containing protein [Clostridia bacterium]
PKHFYSIYRKMNEQAKQLDEIYDLFATRVIVPTVSECYAVLGLVHELYKPIPGRFRDYIAMPKGNGYQSLHTTVIGHRGIAFEVQIRTQEMHRTAEYGIAAHWRYKEGAGEKKQNVFEVRLAWLRQLLEWQSDMSDAGDYMDALKEGLLPEEVFVFTPMGKVIALPAGAVPVDFAYHIHSDIGNSMYGAKVNGRMVSLNYELKNGDIVEILTSDKVRGPSRDWLSIVKSSSARNKISSWFKRERRDENVIRGRELLGREIQKLGFHTSDLLNKKHLAPILRQYSIHSIDDLLAGVGYGGLPAGRIVPKLRDSYITALPEKERVRMGYRVSKSGQVIHNPSDMLVTEALILDKADAPLPKKKAKKHEDVPVKVKGLENALVKISRCCNPVPGDQIIGYVTRGMGVAVHRIDCPNIRSILDSFDRSPEDAERASRLIDVLWVSETGSPHRRYPVNLRVIARDRANLLAEISAAIAEEHVSVLSARLSSARDISANLLMTVEIENQEQYDRLVGRIKAVDSVVSVARGHN